MEENVGKDPTTSTKKPIFTPEIKVDFYHFPKQVGPYFYHFVVKEVIDHFNKHSYHVQQAVIYTCCLVSVLLLSALLELIPKHSPIT